MYRYEDIDGSDASPAGFDVQRIYGCLLGGALGDALGTPLRHMRLAEIQREFGLYGPAQPMEVRGLCSISDDTQLSLFTAEGILRAIARDERRGECNPAEVIYHAYLRWLNTQGVIVPGGQVSVDMDGWLAGCPSLFVRHAMGNEGLSALGSGRMGSVWAPINDSRQSGGVIRVAPIGLAACIEETFALGADVAAITHGHPSAYLSSGAFACIIRSLMEGMPVRNAVSDAISQLQPYFGHEPVRRALERAVFLADDVMPSPYVVESLGGGWVAEEALAIAAYSAMVYEDDFAAAIRLAANHSGDSHAAACLAGNLMGARLGRAGIPDHWVDNLELHREIKVLAGDLAIQFSEEDGWACRYPGR